MASVLLAGLGNIGSPLAALVARLRLDRLVLVDRDRVEAKNVRSQDYRSEDVGRFKAEAIAQRLRESFSNLEIECWTRDLEDLPHGVAEVDLVLGALDSRRARQVLATELAGPLGVPLIDGGVGEGQRGRVQVFAGISDAACLECGWGREDYRLLSQEYRCDPEGRAGAPATAAPAFLGAATASLMTAEAVRILADGPPSESCEVAFDLLHRRHLLSRLRRNPQCRGRHAIITDHVTLNCFGSATAGELCGTIRQRVGQEVPVHLECRRKLGPAEGFAPGRLLDLNWLREAGHARLCDLGFDRRDLIRVETSAGAFFVRFE